MKVFLVFNVLFFALFSAQAYDNKNIYYGQMKNKSTMVVLNDTSRTDVSLNMYIKTSPALENKNNPGITRLLSYLILSNIVQLDSSYANTKLSFYDEYTLFSFTLPNKEIEIERIISNIFRPILLDSTNLNAVRTVAHESYQKSTNVSSKYAAFEERINQAMWSDYVYKKGQSNENDSIHVLTSKDLKTYYDRYFKSYYSLFVVKGSFNAQDKFISINENILNDESLNSTYIPISTLNIYNNLNTSSQLVYIDSTLTSDHIVNISYQLASNYQDKNGYVKATIIEELLNYYQHQLFDSIGIRNFEMNTKLYKNATTYNLSYISSENEKQQFYQLIRTLENIDFTKLLTSTNLIDLLKMELRKYSVENKSMISLEKNIVENWSINHIEDFFTYDKKVKGINITDLAEFYKMYIKNRPFVVSVIKNSTGEDDLLEVDERYVKNIEVQYDYNLADLTHEEEIDKVNRVLQWMLINPTSFLQINGYADKAEYLKVNSPEIDSFVIKYPKFNLVSSFKGKNTWKRLDMFRAIKLCKFLIDNGVNPDKLNGSGVLLSSDEDEDKRKHQKVTFTSFLTR